MDFTRVEFVYMALQFGLLFEIATGSLGDMACPGPFEIRSNAGSIEFSKKDPLEPGLLL